MNGITLRHPSGDITRQLDTWAWAWSAPSLYLQPQLWKRSPRGFLTPEGEEFRRHEEQPATEAKRSAGLWGGGRSGKHGVLRPRQCFKEEVATGSSATDRPVAWGLGQVTTPSIYHLEITQVILMRTSFIGNRGEKGYDRIGLRKTGNTTDSPWGDCLQGEQKNGAWERACSQERDF